MKLSLSVLTALAATQKLQDLCTPSAELITTNIYSPHFDFNTEDCSNGKCLLNKTSVDACKRNANKVKIFSLVKANGKGSLPHIRGDQLVYEDTNATVALTLKDNFMPATVPKDQVGYDGINFDLRLFTPAKDLETLVKGWDLSRHLALSLFSYQWSSFASLINSHSELFSHIFLYAYDYSGFKYDISREFTLPKNKVYVVFKKGPVEETIFQKYPWVKGFSLENVDKQPSFSQFRTANNFFGPPKDDMAN
ncbi:hypothetical protein DSO57_1017467 [Entomophthora muscae]|uniref:Uncharacterized protein n=1 Tax=Entomophthora muscae TaxID=34485 RepID=A0ACC2S6Z6_9FUNG|nr:hypothetical protein DSO57_1017467 [Entomophthora muscae]